MGHTTVWQVETYLFALGVIVICALRCRNRVIPGELPDHFAGNKRHEVATDVAHTEITSHSAFVVPAEGSVVLLEAFFKNDA